MRLRYWKMAADELIDANYPVEKANHWEIKCTVEEHRHFGVFWYRYGTPYDKEPIHGLCFYHNEIPLHIVREITEFLQSKAGGRILYRKTRVFLQGSNEFSDPRAIANLAKELSSKFNVPAEITIEFEKVTQEEQEKNIFRLPSNKMLPIVGPD
jgi:hypothetical protein